MQCLGVYIAVQQRVPGQVPGRILKEQTMTNPLNQTLTSAERVNNAVAEIFQAATIALVGVLGILTVAASI